MGDGKWGFPSRDGRGVGGACIVAPVSDARARSAASASVTFTPALAATSPTLQRRASLSTASMVRERTRASILSKALLSMTATVPLKACQQWTLR